MSKHTQGPWFVRYCDDESFMVMTVISTKDYGRGNYGKFNNEDDTIAVVYHQKTPVVMQDADDANSYLIAAAPDLLAALKDCLPLLENYYRDSTGSCCELLAARAAIAKAEGDNS